MTEMQMEVLRSSGTHKDKYGCKNTSLPCRRTAPQQVKPKYRQPHQSFKESTSCLSQTDQTFSHTLLLQT
eukprot:3411870-Amphidinium_carterae.1